MKPDERSLRRALAARSGDLDPSFHSQLTSKLTGAPARGAAWRWESWAVAAALMASPANDPTRELDPP